VNQDDVMEKAEGLICSMFEAGMGEKLEAPFPRMTYADAMDKYGLDRPDVRFGLEHIDVTDLMKSVDFKVFSGPANNGGLVKVIRVPNGCEKLSRKKIDNYTKFVAIYGARGLAYIKVNDKDDIPNGLQSPIVKNLSEDVLKALLERCEAENGDLLFFGADTKEVVNNALGYLRVELGKDLGLFDEKTNNFVWVVDFPMFEWDSENKRLQALHHPFTAPYDEDLDKLESSPLEMRSQAYDLVWNGTEIGGGSIRIHKSDVQARVLKALGISDEEAADKFGFLLKALEYGAPPHGGLAFGLDRVLSLMVGAESIRDVIAFPKTQKAADPMAESPSQVGDMQWKELGLRKRRTQIDTES